MTETKNKNKKNGKITHSFMDNIQGIYAQISSSHRGLDIAVSNVIGISRFSHDETVLLFKKGSAILKGDFLEIAVFEDNTVEIRGRIEEIRFNYPKRRGQSDAEA